MNSNNSEDSDDPISASLPKMRLFILGSGFSRPAGHPLGIELLAMVRAEMQSRYQVHGWDGPLEEEILEWQALYPNTELALEAVLAYSHRKHFLKLNGSDEYFEHGSRVIAGVRPIIQEILSAAVPASAKELYERFASELTPHDLVMTFNYDTVLEDSLDSLEVPYSLSPEWWLKDGSKFEFVNILKLHGSIDWYDRRYYDDTRAFFDSRGDSVPDKDPLFGPKAYVPIEPLTRGEVSEGWADDLLTRVFRVPNHGKHFPFHSGSISEVPFLLPPAYDKILGHDPIRELWSNMHRTSDAYSGITIIGYSMPAYDSYAYEALGHLIINYQLGGDKNKWGQPRVPLQIITLADSTKEVLDAIPFLNPKCTRIWTKGFNEDAIDWMDLGE